VGRSVINRPRLKSHTPNVPLGIGAATAEKVANDRNRLIDGGPFGGVMTLSTTPPLSNRSPTKACCSVVASKSQARS
jgi:hypothetical protein